MALSRAQFGEYSRSGKPKKAYSTQAEAAKVAALHLQTYGTIAKPYQGRDKQWYVTTDRAETASKNVAEDLRRREEAKNSLTAPIIASDIKTREERHVGTGLSHILMVGGMSKDSPRHEQYLDWVVRLNRSRPWA